FLRMTSSFRGGGLAMRFLPWYYPPLCTFVGWGVAWIGYRGALRSAIPYTQLIKAAFDLHRGTLLKTIGWTEPTSYGEERKRWPQICQLWHRGAPAGAVGARELGYPISGQSKQRQVINVKLQIEEPTP